MANNFYPHKSGLGLMEPAFLVNQNVCVMMSAIDTYRKVKWFEPIPPFQFLDIGALAAGAQSARTQAANLALFDAELGQFRWFPLDNIQVRLFLPQANGRYLLRNIQAPVDASIVERDPCLHLTEMYVWEDKTPWFEALNFSDYGINTSRLVGFGYRFVTEELGSDVVSAIKAGREPCTYVTAAGSSGRPE